MALVALRTTNPYGNTPVIPAGGVMAATSLSWNTCSTSTSVARIPAPPPSVTAPVGTNWPAMEGLAVPPLNSTSELNGVPAMVVALATGLLVTLLTGAPVPLRTR